MRAIVTADLQLDDNPLNEYRHQFMEKLPDIVRKSGSDLLMILGDLTEQKDRHNARLVNRIADHIDQVARVGDVVVLRGNHDYLDIENPFFRFVRHMPNVMWIDRPNSWPGKWPGWLFLPNTLDHVKDWEGLDFTKYKFIFTHNTFQGADIGARRLDGIPVNVFPETVEVISGDIHKPQQFDVIRYVGAPYLVDFGDDYVPRMIMLTDDTWEEIKCTGPKKLLLHTAWREKDFQGKPPWTDLRQGDILKVRLDITGEQVPQWTEIKTAVHEWGATNGFRICGVHPIVASAGGAKPRIYSHNQRRKSDASLVEEYGRHRKLSPLTVKAGIDLMQSPSGNS